MLEKLSVEEVREIIAESKAASLENIHFYTSHCVNMILQTCAMRKNMNGATAVLVCLNNFKRW